MTADVEEYPRKLTLRESGYLNWLLPEDRRGYLEFRNKLEGFVVIGEGRRGKGNLVLGKLGDEPEEDAPLAPVFAFGTIEGIDQDVLVTIREKQGEQVEVEVVGSKSDEVPDSFIEKRRWSYSRWSPSELGPESGAPVREVKISGKEDAGFFLALCPQEKRLWIHNESTQVNYLIPVTNYFNELMMVKGIRDPSLALESSNLFTHLRDFTDEELARAFLSYNRLRRKVEVGSDRVEISHEDSRWRKLLKFLLRR